LRVLKLHSSLRFALSSAVFAGLWALESRARERANQALAQLQTELELRIVEQTASLAAENAQLIKLDQLKSKFIADAAHELRAPITSLNLRLYLLEHAAPDRHAEYLADLRYQLTRLNRLSEDLLAISRLDSLDATSEFTPLDLNRVVEEVVIAYRPMAEAAGLGLVSHYAPGLPLVLGDYGQLAQVGSNLVANAIHYTPSGQVTVSTILDVKLRQVCLQVQDTGVGIVPADLPHLFERFYRGHSRNGASGTGLGLSIVKEIVDLHGGSIEVESHVGSGSVFKVCLPLAEADTAGSPDSK
jgi:signal transduction histidine kinase